MGYRHYDDGVFRVTSSGRNWLGHPPTSREFVRGEVLITAMGEFELPLAAWSQIGRVVQAVADLSPCIVEEHGRDFSIRERLLEDVPRDVARPNGTRPCIAPHESPQGWAPVP